MERLRSFAGYAALPAVLDALAFVLPPFQLASSRLVNIGERLWELWSPNSEEAEYYPGVPTPEFDADKPLDPRLRRADGHLGRFDPTVNPQVFNPLRLWYPFVRTSAPNDDYPEFAQFADVWDERRIEFVPGFLEKLRARVEVIATGLTKRPEFAGSHPELWAARPRYSLLAEMESLGAASSFHEALDLYSEIQRHAKLAAAWTRMVYALLDFPPDKVSILKIPSANHGMIGTWLNGADHKLAMWLMSLGIPCFIIHECESYWDLKRNAASIKRHSFLQGTRTEKRMEYSEASDSAMLDRGWELRTDEDQDCAVAQEPVTRYVDRARSSSYAQGWYLMNHTVAPPPPLSLVERDGIILPPRVSNAGPGQWSHWVEDVSEEGFPRMVSVGKKAHKSGHEYFDRERRRVLYFDDKVYPLRHYKADPRVYGLPVPDLPFFQSLQNFNYSEKPRSLWMYLTRTGVAPVEADMDLDSEEGNDDSLMGPRYTPMTGVQTVENRSEDPHPTSPSPRVSDTLSNDRRPRSPDSYRSPTSRPRNASPVRRLPIRRPSIERSTTRRVSPRRAAPEILPPLRFTDHYSPPRELQRASWNRRRSPSPVRRAAVARRPLTSSRRSRSPEPGPSRRGRSRSPPRRSQYEPPRYRPLLGRMNRSRSRSPSRPVSGTLPDARGHQPVRADAPLSLERRLAPPSASSIEVYDRLPPAELERLSSLFPRSDGDIFSGQQVVGEETKILAVTNLPSYYHFVDVLRWLRSGLPRSVRKPRITRVLRTFEQGQQVYWVVMKSVTDAATLRGVLSQRSIQGSPLLNVVFASSDDYSRRSSAFRDAWSPRYGMEIGNREAAVLTIFDRLGLVNPHLRPTIMAPYVASPPANFLDYVDHEPTDLLSRLGPADGGAL